MIAQAPGSLSGVLDILALMVVYDYNGTGRWSREAVLERYKEYMRRFPVPAPRDLTPFEHADVKGRRIYPVMFKVIEGIQHGDAACIELGIELIESDQRMPFGMILKSNAAKALRRVRLTAAQQERVRERVFAMLLAGHVPREYREYAKLLRKIGAGAEWEGVVGRIDRGNPHVMRYFDYFMRHVVD
jgi:hypothetical protein